MSQTEICWVKVKLKGNKDLHIGSYYMAHRSEKDLLELEKSLQHLEATKN
jgi:hypothetical protein